MIVLALVIYAMFSHDSERLTLQFLKPAHNAGVADALGILQFTSWTSHTVFDLPAPCLEVVIHARVSANVDT